MNAELHDVISCSRTPPDVLMATLYIIPLTREDLCAAS